MVEKFRQKFVKEAKNISKLTHPYIIKVLDVLVINSKWKRSEQVAVNGNQASPRISPSFHTYVIRSWDGERYYKLQIISWYDANVQIGDEGGRISYYLDELK